ncbi:MAG: flagellar protein FlaG [Leptospirillia bacterium]
MDRDRAVSPVQLTEDGHPIRGGEETALAPTGKSRQVQEQVQELAQRVTEALRDVDFPANTSLRFKVDDETEEVVFQVVNRDTEEVVRQYPREEVLDRLALAKDFKGLMLDQEG